ncbi:MAG: hypothetical protein JXQ27_12475 [Acidobacteria bacterium]|nr:hypothetical protein [Acidobacteriota bacterium]
MSSECACCVDTDCTCAANSCVCNDYTIGEKFAYLQQMLETGLDFTRDLAAGQPVASYAGIIHQGFKKALNSYDEIEATLRPDRVDSLMDIRQATLDLVYYLLPQLGKINDPVLSEQVETIRQLAEETEEDDAFGD